MEETSHRYSADSNHPMLMTMEFVCRSERFELMDPPRESRLARPPAGNCANKDNSNFVEFEQEQRSLATHYTSTGSNIFQGTINEQGIPANDSRLIQQFSTSHTVLRPADKKPQRLEVNNFKRRPSQSKTLKHSDARLPEVTKDWFMYGCSLTITKLMQGWMRKLKQRSQGKQAGR